MENDYDMSDNTSSIKKYSRMKRKFSMLPAFDDNNYERDNKRMKYYSNSNNRDDYIIKASPVLRINKNNSSDVDMIYYPKKQETIKK